MNKIIRAILKLKKLVGVIGIFLGCFLTSCGPAGNGNNNSEAQNAEAQYQTEYPIAEESVLESEEKLTEEDTAPSAPVDTFAPTEFPHSGPVGWEPWEPFDQNYTEDEIDGESMYVPLTNSYGVGKIESGNVIGIYSDNYRLYVLRRTLAGELTTQLLSSTVLFPGTLATLGDTIVIVYMDNRNGLMGILRSDDGGDVWTDQIIGEKNSGAALPTACLFRKDGQVEAAVAWIQTNPFSTDEGTLVYTESSGGIFSQPRQIGESDEYSAPALSCPSDRKYLAVRNPRTSTQLGIEFAQQNEDESWPDPEWVFDGADPSLCVAGDYFWIGFQNRGANAYLAASLDGEAWDEPRLLDETAKFVNVHCTATGKFAAVWGDWPNDEDAQQKVGETRTIGGILSLDAMATYMDIRPTGDETSLGPASIYLDEMSLSIITKNSEDESVILLVD